MLLLPVPFFWAFSFLLVFYRKFQMLHSIIASVLPMFHGLHCRTFGVLKVYHHSGDDDAPVTWLCLIHCLDFFFFARVSHSLPERAFTAVWHSLIESFARFHAGFETDFGFPSTTSPDTWYGSSLANWHVKFLLRFRACLYGKRICNAEW